MKRSCIICEGQTDFVLLQYLMERVYGWEDDPTKGKRELQYRNEINKTRSFFKEKRILTITETGGSGDLVKRLLELVSYNKNVIEDGGIYSKIVVFTDNDQEGTKDEWAMRIKAALDQEGINVKNGRKSSYICNMTNSSDQEIEFLVYLVVVPSEKNGAIETFLLEAIKEKDEYDGKIIDKVAGFVNTIDEEKKYLNHRRLLEKARFDVYFSIRTPREAFHQRRDIIRGVPWERYVDMQKEMSVLGEL